MSSTFSTYIGLGLEHARDGREAQRITIMNGVAVVIGLITAPYALLFGWLGITGLAVAVVPIAAVYVVMPLITRRAGFTVPRLIIFTLFPAVVLVYASVLGAGTRIELLHFVGVLLPFLICSVDGDRRLIAYGVTTPMLANAALHVTGFAALGPAQLSAEVQQLVGYALYPTTFSFILVSAFFFARTTARAQARLDRRNADMSLVLDNVQEGLLTVDRDGVVGAERSRAVEAWFGVPAAGATLWSYLGGRVPERAPWLELAFRQLVEGDMPEEVALAQLPSRLSLPDRELAVEALPIRADGRLSKVLVVLRDITAELDRERAEEEQRDFARAVQHLVAGRAVFADFLEESTAQVKVMASSEDPVAVGRAVHTLKGNAALFGLERVARACHQLEDELLSDPVAAFSRRRLEALWTGTAGRFEGLLGTGARVELSRAELGALVDRARGGAKGEALAAELEQLLDEPVDARLVMAGEQARALARRMDKPEPQVRVDGGGVRLDGGVLRTLAAAWGHLVRNAVDHGLETAEVRAAAGKPPAGALTLEARRTGTGVALRFADDGAGIDWGAVARGAERRGLPTGTREALVEALFTDGVSSKDEAGQVSGRGVGLAAVRATVQGLGATLEVDSTPGKGTAFRIQLPVQTGRRIDRAA